MNDKDREDFVIMKYDIEQTKVDVKAIKQNSERLNKEFDKLMFHLVGDKSTETKGWIQKLTRFDYRLTIVERTIVIGSGVFSTAAMYLIFFKNIFSIFT